MSRVIKLQDGLEFEVDMSEEEVLEIGANTLDVSTATVNQVYELLANVVEPVSETYQKLSEEVDVDQLKIALGIKIGAQGNFFIAKSKLEGNINVELTLKGKANG